MNDGGKMSCEASMIQVSIVVVMLKWNRINGSEVREEFLVLSSEFIDFKKEFELF
jgi:hypothetical protein